REARRYRGLADYSVGGQPQCLAGDGPLDGRTRSAPLPPPARTAVADGMRVILGAGPSRAGAQSQLRFAVTRGGRPVPVEPYLGAQGHLVALREGDLAFLHVHPDERSLRFMAQFPSA